MVMVAELLEVVKEAVDAVGSEKSDDSTADTVGVSLGLDDDEKSDVSGELNSELEVSTVSDVSTKELLGIVLKVSTSELTI